MILIDSVQMVLYNPVSEQNMKSNFSAVVADCYTLLFTSQ